MSNNFNNTICSRTSVERYLLNKMTPDEETLFQNHLDSCNDCTDYLNIIRNVAGIGKDELPYIEVKATKTPEFEVLTPKKNFSAALHLSVTMRLIMLAACLIPVCIKYLTGSFVSRAHRTTHISCTKIEPTLNMPTRFR